jgi:hypothetical protein
MSHRVMQNQLRCFVWLPTTNLAAFLEPLWPSYLDACRPIYSLTIVCLSHTTIATSFFSGHYQIEAGLQPYIAALHR